MAQWFNFVYYYLWIAPHVFLVAIAGIMFVRRLYKNYPIFFAYTIYETFEFLLLFIYSLNGHNFGSTYRYPYIATLLGSTALRFGIIQEIFNNIFRDYPRLERLATISMRWVTGLLVCGAILSVFYASASAPADMMIGVKVLDRAVAIIQVGLLLFLFSFSRLFGLFWRSYTFGLALGFAVLGCAQIVNWTIGLLSLTEQSKYFLDLLPMGVYHISVVVWLGYLLAVEKPVGPTIYTTQDIDRWSGELERSK